ncbi:hypothetical protein [Anaerobium acetethylicum]|uniref:Uncharacterized protein n=1 Tax=Anaerobium acetethylicum TaxID=1619234 RepID=A0A1D3TZL0_9FIRM|nr:hypothetical protein [Anaerobium acetethylicum]SCP99978.1 hypothetical protein SAMN05421730_10821 [Anaerobium acetethylicum]
MEMCYDGALVMPSSYAVMGEEEMTYLEAGEAYLSNKAIKAVMIACALNPIATTLISLGIYKAVSMVKRAWTAVCANLGKLGGAIGCVIGFLLGAFTAAAIATTLIDALWCGKGIELGFTWRPTLDVK